MSDNPDFDLSAVENFISGRLADLQRQRASLRAQLSKLDEAERAFRETVRRLVSSRSEQAPERAALNKSRRPGKSSLTIEAAAQRVIKQSDRPMSRFEILEAVRESFPEQFQNLKLGSLYPFLREIGRRDDFVFDKTSKCFRYVGRVDQQKHTSDTGSSFGHAENSDDVAA
jgi:hypothetical protein